MRFIKFTLALLLVSILLISLVFFARKQIVSYGINNYFDEHKAQLSCIDFNLTPSLDIIINKICIHSPQADIELENVSVQLQWSSTLQVNAINAETMKIQGNVKLLEKSDSNQRVFDDNSVKHYLSTLAQFTLPFPITIKALTYLPFYQADKAQKPVFYGNLSANKDNANFSLKNTKEVNILSATFFPEGKSFTAKLNANLAPLKQFLAVHQLALPAKLNNNIIIKGKLSTQLQWHEEILTATSKLDNFAIDSFAIDSPNGIAQSGSFNINGKLSWQTNITANQALFTIDEQSVMNINFSDKKLLEFLAKKNISTDVLTAIKDNPSNGLLIKPQGKIQIDFSKQQVFISKVKLAAKNKEKPLQLAFTDTYLTYEINKKAKKNNILKFTLKQSNYAANTTLLISRLNSISKQPINIVSAGKIKHNKLGWHITFLPTTTLELSRLALSTLELSESGVSRTNLNSTKTNTLSIKEFTTNWQGNIHIDNNGLTELSLQLNSQVSQLQIANLAQITQVELKADISGKLQNIDILSSIIVDNQPLANIKLNGAITKPQLEIFAKNLALTNLLALKLNLPIDVSLIDGSISYHLQGQLTDTNNWLNNAAKLDVSIQDVTGEVENTWIQALNWQQEFILSNGDINSVNVDKQPKKNLTIAKIETAPPLTELSAQTTLSFKNKAFSVIATQINTNTLGGSVNIAQAQWPFTASRSVNVQLTSIDLETLLALDPKQGIIVTGKISGSLPVALNDKQFTITGGKLHNVGNGIIKVANNPTVEQLKASDLQLKLAFDAMQNIHYHQLSSDVSMANDGYMLFDTVIKGRNPDIDNDVNLNLNLSYDLLGLLKSLNISNNLEQTLIDSLQKN